jgi:hypothetical protein
LVVLLGAGGGVAVVHQRRRVLVDPGIDILEGLARFILAEIVNDCAVECGGGGVALVLVYALGYAMCYHTGPVCSNSAIQTLESPDGFARVDMTRACRGCQKVYASSFDFGVRLLVLLNEVVFVKKMQDMAEVAVEFLQRLRGPYI